MINRVLAPIHFCTDHAIDQVIKLKKERGNNDKGAVGHLQMRSSSPPLLLQPPLAASLLEPPLPLLE
jgi:hypothetical protein